MPAPSFPPARRVPPMVPAALTHRHPRPPLAEHPKHSKLPHHIQKKRKPSAGAHEINGFADIIRVMVEKKIPILHLPAFVSIEGDADKATIEALCNGLGTPDFTPRIGIWEVNGSNEYPAPYYGRMTGDEIGFIKNKVPYCTIKLVTENWLAENDKQPGIQILIRLPQTPLLPRQLLSSPLLYRTQCIFVPAEKIAQFEKNFADAFEIGLKEAMARIAAEIFPQHESGKKDLASDVAKTRGYIDKHFLLIADNMQV